jgi:hypothetical protein
VENHCVPKVFPRQQDVLFPAFAEIARSSLSLMP